MVDCIVLSRQIKSSIGHNIRPRVVCQTFKLAVVQCTHEIKIRCFVDFAYSGGHKLHQNDLRDR